MGESKLYGKSGGGLKIDGLIKDYYAYAGESINAGSFVEFVNGVASSTTETSVDTQLSAESHSGYRISAVELPNGNVFIAHSVDGADSTVLYGMVITIDKTAITYGTDTLLVNYGLTGATISTVVLPNGNVFIAHNYGTNNYLYGIVCTISGTTITAGTKTILNNSATDMGFSISASLLPNGNVFIAHSYGTKYYLFGIVCTISGTNITIGTDTQLCSTSYAGYAVSTSILSNGNVFIAHNYSSNHNLYGIICTISGTTITTGTDTALSGDYFSGRTISTQLLKNGNVFVAHNYNSLYYLYGIVCTISGTNITIGTDTAIKEISNYGYTIATTQVTSGSIFIAHSGGSTYNAKMMVATISGTTITAGDDLDINSEEKAGYALSTVLLQNGTIFVAHSYGTDYYLYGRVYSVTDNVPTANVTIPTYETQVRKATSQVINGVAKTKGTGGTSTAHGESLKVYVPNI